MNNLKSTKKSPIVIYTITFAIIFCLYYLIFIKAGKTLLWNSDGINQHFSILYNFNEVVRNFIKHPLRGIPEWSWNIAYGNDIIGTYSYYILGDPFAYLSLLFPMKKLQLAFTLLIVLRLYCVGLAFIFYSRKMKFSNEASILGAISYAFSGFVMMTAIRHPYFINPLIILPLVFICIEYILENKRKYLFSIIVAITMISNFYFSYMIAIIAIIYALLRFIELKDIRKIKFKKYFLDLFVYLFIGILMSCIVLLPTLYAIFTSSRIVSDPHKTLLIYPIGYYLSLLYSCVSSGGYPFWTIITCPILTYMLLPLFIRLRKRYKTYFYMLIIFTIMILIPLVGLGMNGFGSVSNRWTFAFMFLASIIIAVGFDNLKEINKKDIIISLIIIMVFVVLGVLNSIFSIFSNNVYPNVILGIITLIFIFNYMRKSNKERLKNKNIFTCLLVLLSLSIIVNNFYRYDDKGNGYVEEFFDKNKALSYYTDSFGGVQNYIKDNDKSFYRIAKADNISRSKTRNNSFVLNYNGIDSYLSITNGYMAKFSKDLNNRAFTPNSPIINFDNRPIVSSIMGVKYYISKDNKDPRFDPSVKKIYSNGKFAVYENKNVLPFGFVYSKVMNEDTYNNLDGLQREEALLYCANVDSKDVKGNVESIPSNLKEISFDTKNSTAKIEGNKIIVSKPNEKVVLNIKENETQKGNLFVNINDLQFTQLQNGLRTQKEVEDYNNGKDKRKFLIRKLKNTSAGDYFNITVSYKNIDKNFENPDTLDASGYFKMSDLFYNLGYYKNIKSGDSITLTFDKAGEYDYKSLKVLNLPIEEYNDEIKKLSENSFNIESISDKKVVGNIDSKVDGILTFQIPYSRGWNVKIDGKEVKTLRVNEAFLGVNIKSGKHSVELTYKTPFLRTGVIFTVIGVILLIFISLYKRKNSEKNM